MKNELLTTLTLLTICWPAFSQTPDSVSYQNSLGIMASPQLDKFFTANRSLPVGLIYRRQLKPDQAVRLSVLGAYKRQSFTSTNVPENLTITTNSLLQVMAGYEWQKNLSKRWTLYYGSDAGISIKNIIEDIDDKTYATSQGNASRIFLAENKYRSFNFRPFAGAQFQITPKLTIALETAVSALFTRNESDSNLAIHLESTNELFWGEHVNGIWRYYTLQYLPLSNIQLIYHF